MPIFKAGAHIFLWAHHFGALFTAVRKLWYSGTGMKTPKPIQHNMTKGASSGGYSGILVVGYTFWSHQAIWSQNDRGHEELQFTVVVLHWHVTSKVKSSNLWAYQGLFMICKFKGFLVYHIWFMCIISHKKTLNNNARYASISRELR